MLNNLGAGGHRDLAGGVLGAVLLSPRLLPSVRQSETEVRAGVHSTKYSTVVACAVRDSCPVSWITHLLLGLGFLSAPAPMRSPPSSPVGFSLKFRFSSPCCPKINRATLSPGPWHRRTMGLLPLNRLLSMRQDRRRRPIQGRSKPPPVTSPGRSLYSSLVLCLRVLTSTTSTFCHRPITRIFIFIFIFSITCSIVVLIELRG